MKLLMTLLLLTSTAYANQPNTRELYQLCTSKDMKEEGFCYGFINAKVGTIDNERYCLDTKKSNTEIVGIFITNYPKIMAIRPDLSEAPAVIGLLGIVFYEEGCVIETH